MSCQLCDLTGRRFRPLNAGLLRLTPAVHGGADLLDRPRRVDRAQHSRRLDREDAQTSTVVVSERVTNVPVRHAGHEVTEVAVLFGDEHEAEAGHAATRSRALR